MNLVLTEEQIKKLVSKRIDELEKSSFRELSEKDEKNAYASFVVVKLPNGKIAATTRPYEKSKNHKIGLPGGKIEDNETSLEAAYRESEEEGWNVKIDKIIASKIINGKPIVWYLGSSAKKLDDYKEQNRGIKPIEVSIKDISSSGYGNDFIGQLFDNEEDVNEQETAPAAASSTSSTSSGGSTSSAYPQVGKWESGVTRGPSNQIGLTKWSDIVGSTLKRGKANPLK